MSTTTYLFDFDDTLISTKIYSDIYEPILLMIQNRNLKRKVDSLLDFPRNAVHSGTEASLTTVFEMGTGELRPYGRPIASIRRLFINFILDSEKFNRK